MVNKTLGCVFCDMTGSVSATNQHVRSFHKALMIGRRSRTREFHHLEISHAFENLLKAQPALINSVSPERLAVLTAFANAATRELTPDEAAAWSRREYQIHGNDWWDREVDRAIKKYRRSSYDAELLDLHVRRVVDQSIEDCHYTPPAPVPGPSRAASRTTALGGSGLFTVSSNLTMQGARSKHQYKHGNRSSASAIGQGDSVDRRTYINISDGDDNHDDNGDDDDFSRHYHHHDDEDDDDDDLYAAPPAKLSVTKRGPSSTTGARTVSSSSAGGVRPQPAQPARAASAGARLPAQTPAERPLPFLTLNVCGITNRVQPLEIDFGTTLAEALALAAEHAPLWMRARAFCFEGAAPGVWAGEWPAWRWRQLMREAESSELVVDLRLVPVE